MPCQPFRTPDGATAIICSGRARQRRCVGCGKPAGQLCDWKVPSKRSGTCDAPICVACSHRPAPEKDLCPDHARQWKARLARKAAA